MIDSKGKIPQYGDADDGMAFILDFSPTINNLESLLISGAILFSDKILKSGSKGYDLKNEILFGGKGHNAFNSIPEDKVIKSSIFFPQEGHFILRNIIANKELLLHFNSGSLGYLSIAAHGHADALSFSLHYNGYPVFIDSGTYCYHSDHEWRQYFIGTLAHNTIRMNEQNQAENGGPTLWTNRYQTKLIESYSSRESDMIHTSHDGYSSQEIIHYRKINLNKLENIVIIEDSIEMGSNKDVVIEFPLHLHPEIKIKKDQTNIYELILPNEDTILLHMDNKLNPVLVNGSQEPILGWYSTAFYQKTPCPVIYSKLKIDRSIKFQTIIKIGDKCGD